MEEGEAKIFVIHCACFLFSVSFYAVLFYVFRLSFYLLLLVVALLPSTRLLLFLPLPILVLFLPFPSLLPTPARHRRASTGRRLVRPVALPHPPLSSLCDLFPFLSSSLPLPFSVPPPFTRPPSSALSSSSIASHRTPLFLLSSTFLPGIVLTLSACTDALLPTVSYLQPEPQSYGTPAFPTAHGRTASFFRDDSVQTQFAYIPDDGSGVYVVDVIVSTSVLSFVRSLVPPFRFGYLRSCSSPCVGEVRTGGVVGSQEFLDRGGGAVGNACFSVRSTPVHARFSPLLSPPALPPPRSRSRPSIIPTSAVPPIAHRGAPSLGSPGGIIYTSAVWCTGEGRAKTGLGPPSMGCLPPSPPLVLPSRVLGRCDARRGEAARCGVTDACVRSLGLVRRVYAWMHAGILCRIRCALLGVGSLFQPFFVAVLFPPLLLSRPNPH